MKWPDERITRLKQLHADPARYSNQEIARTLGGVTRNAVIGMAHRLGLSRPERTPNAESVARQLRRERQWTVSAKPARHRRGGITHVTIAPDSQPMPAEPPPPPVDDCRCTLHQLTASTCRWPIGDPQQKGFYFCGGIRTEPFPYCGYHARVAYNVRSRAH
jgi:GcrA cell cycle regulator